MIKQENFEKRWKQFFFTLSGTKIEEFRFSIDKAFVEVDRKIDSNN